MTQDRSTEAEQRRGHFKACVTRLVVERFDRAPVDNFEKALWQFAMWAPYGGRILTRLEDPYLLRVYLTPEGTTIAGTRPFLHYFVRGDRDKNPHSHPWWAKSLILTGGYSEQRLVGNRLLSRLFLPWSINHIAQSTFHRVDLLKPEEGCWTLILTGPHVETTGSEWGFFDLESSAFRPWASYEEPA